MQRAEQLVEPVGAMHETDAAFRPHHGDGGRDPIRQAGVVLAVGPGAGRVGRRPRARGGVVRWIAQHMIERAGHQARGRAAHVAGDSEKVLALAVASYNFV